MSPVVPIMTAKGALFKGVSGTCTSRKIFETEVSEMQSSALWTLKFSKCLDSILNM